MHIQGMSPAETASYLNAMSQQYSSIEADAEEKKKKADAEAVADQNS
jgi:hypothetical protein